MGNEADWNTFARTGKVTDYLAYAKSEKEHTHWENEEKKERGQRERTSDGNSAFGSYRW